MSVFYGFTVKKLGITFTDCDYNMYDDWANRASGEGFYLYKYHWEYDSKGVLHWHGIGTAEPRFRWKRIALAGYTVHCFRIRTNWDMESWQKYIMKDGLTNNSVKEDMAVLHRTLEEYAELALSEQLEYYKNNVELSDEEGIKLSASSGDSGAEECITGTRPSERLRADSGPVMHDERAIIDTVRTHEKDKCITF